MNFPFYIAKRYLFSKSSTNAINIITIIATVGVMVSSAVLFIILSGFSGLRTFSYSLLDASEPDIKIIPSTGKRFVFTSDIDSILSSNSSVDKYTRVVEERAFLQNENKKTIAQIKGVDIHYNQITNIDSILQGEWLDKEFPNAVVIGDGIGYKLELGLLTQLQVMVPKAGKSFLNPNNAFNSKKIQVLGFFSGSVEFREGYVFMNIETAQELLNFKPDEISLIELKVSDSNNVDAIKDELQKKLGNSFKVKTKAELNSMYYKVINTENFIGYLLGTLITIIALFNILGSIIMMIVDKKDNLHTLFKIGTLLNDIKKIFVYQGFLLTLLGMIIGLSIAVGLVLFQQRYQVFMMTPTQPHLVEFQWYNLLIVIITIIILGFLASKIASSRINKTFIEGKS